MHAPMLLFIITPQNYCMIKIVNYYHVISVEAGARTRYLDYILDWIIAI